MAEHNILLGFIDERITNNFINEIDFRTNKLGGYPNWMEPEIQEKNLFCELCGSRLPLLLQIYAPIKELVDYHRTLYLFACINSSCWGHSKSWKCLKRQCIMKEFVNSVPIEMVSIDWCADADIWNDDDAKAPCIGNGQNSTENNATVLLERISIDSDDQNSSVNSVSKKNYLGVNHIPSAEFEPYENDELILLDAVLPRFTLDKLSKQSEPATIYDCEISFEPWFLRACDEERGEDELLDHVRTLLSNYNECASSNIIVEASTKSEETYEKSRPAHGDKLFHSFLFRIKSNPGHVLRYCRNNSAPLFLYHEPNLPKSCPGCHGDMIFEMQILSTIINYLRLQGSSGCNTEFLDFGSIFIYTCKKSCDDSKEEVVIVQNEK